MRTTKKYLCPIYFDSIKFDFVEHNFKNTNDYECSYFKEIKWKN